MYFEEEERYLYMTSEIFGEIAKTRDRTKKGMSRRGIGPIQCAIRRMRRGQKVTTKEELGKGESMWNIISNVPELSQGAKLNSQ